MKMIIFALGCSILFGSCIQSLDREEPGVFISFREPYINDDLKKASIDFVENFSIENSIIEVTIEKKEPVGIYIIFQCRGLAYFGAMNLYPTFTYELNNNSFFVFTGAEDFFNVTFDEQKFKLRRQAKCGEPVKACYWYSNREMMEDTVCTFPHPFSDLRMSEPPRK